MGKPKGSVRQFECWVEYWEGDGPPLFRDPVFDLQGDCVICATRDALRQAKAEGSQVRRARLIVDLESKG